MTGDWQRIRALFERASELPAARRAAWLDAEAGATGEIRREVDRLLTAAQVGATFLEPPGDATLAAHTAPPPALPARLGPFQVLERIGSVGMGTVLRARQDHPQREVAVKVVHAGFGSARLRERFQAEIDVLARLQHPGIAPVFEAGVEADGTAWFAMELLHDAAPITTHAQRGALDVAERLACFRAVCDAVQHAHQRGVIHRDLKPANILATPDGTVKVIDFGIARVVDADHRQRTLAGELLGTLAYMSPEQVEGGETDVRTDVYGLGVVLYELLAERRPFELEGMPLTAACRAIVERDAPAVRRDRPSLPPELDWIVARALRKDPGERYASVADLAADVDRCRRHEPVLAAPPGVAYRARKFVRRHRLAVAAGGIVLAVSIAAFVTTAIALVRTQHAEAAEREGRTAAEAANRRGTAALDFLLDVFASVNPSRDGRDIKMVDALARTAKDFDARLAGAPRIRAELGRTIGLSFLGLGKLDEAETHLRTCLSGYEREFGRDHAKTVRVAANLVQVLLERGQLDEAETLQQRTDAACEALPADDSLRVGIVINRANLQRARGDKVGAAATLRPLVDRLMVAKPDDRQTLVAMNLLAGVLHGLGKLDEAQPLYQAAVDGFAKRGEKDSPDALLALNNLGALRYSRGERETVLPLLEEVLATRRRVLGDSHPSTIGAMCNVASVHYGLGHFAPAAQGFRDALVAFGAYDKTDKDDQSVVQTLLANLATSERELEHLGEAIRLGERVLTVRTQKLGAGHDATLQTAAMVADAHRLARDFDRALAMFVDCRDRAQSASPPQWTNVYRAELGVARSLLGKADYAGAERSLLRCRELFDQAEGAAPVKGQLLRAEPLLVDLYLAWGKPEAAAHYREK